MTRKDQIKSAYRMAGDLSSFYDGMMTYSTFLGKAICRIVWNMDGEKNLSYLEKALSGIPEDFRGELLEVPVGTGVLTMPVYKYLPDARITCLDYSGDMMASAQAKAEHMGIKNVSFIRQLQAVLRRCRIHRHQSRSGRRTYTVRRGDH